MLDDDIQDVQPEARAQAQLRLMMFCLTTDYPHPPGGDVDSDDNNTDYSTSSQLVQDIEQWQAGAEERRLAQLAQRASADKLDLWLCYIGWPALLQQLQHDLAGTYASVQAPDDDAYSLGRMLDM